MTKKSGPQKEGDESDEGEQLTALVKAEVRDLSHIGFKSAGVNHYSTLENQRQVLVRLMTFLTSSPCYIHYLANTKTSFSLSTHVHLYSLEKVPSAHTLYLKFWWMTP